MVIVLMGAIVLISSLASSNPWGIVCGLIMVMGAHF
jgi:F0F1-type ATP synthase assembly protein I